MQYQKISKYRYRVFDAVELAIINPQLSSALFNEEVEHPFFRINSFCVTAKKEYAWDGATGAIPTRNLVVPSLVHDIGCQAINMGLLPREFRPLFDYEYYLQCRKYGVSELRARLHLAVITLWGMIPKTESLKSDYSRVHFIFTGDR